MVRREVGGAPSYDEVDYWEKRFTRVAIDKSAKQDGIEWLGKGDEIVKTIKEIANRTKYDQFGHMSGPRRRWERFARQARCAG